MSKELEALENLWNGQKTTENYKILETALKEYNEGLENAKTYVHRNAKDALFNLEVLAMKNTSRSFWKLPQQLADDVKKELKVLEIIKEKKVDIALLMSCCCYKQYCDFYIERWRGVKNIQLPTIEEYELLKKVLL